MTRQHTATQGRDVTDGTHIHIINYQIHPKIPKIPCSQFAGWRSAAAHLPPPGPGPGPARVVHLPPQQGPGGGQEGQHSDGGHGQEVTQEPGTGGQGATPTW